MDVPIDPISERFAGIDLLATVDRAGGSGSTGVADPACAAKRRPRSAN